MDRIIIRDLEVECIIGVERREREQLQKVVLTLELECDLQPGTTTDKVADTLDYSVLKQRVCEEVQTASCELIECLARRVADVCLGFSRVERVTVTLDKPGVLRYARSVAVELTREKNGDNRLREKK